MYSLISCSNKYKFYSSYSELITSVNNLLHPKKVLWELGPIVLNYRKEGLEKNAVHCYLGSDGSDLAIARQ